MHARRLFFAIAAAILISLFSPAVLRAVDSRDIDAALLNGIRFIYSEQKDGLWEDAEKSAEHATARTALALHALLSAGESHQDERLAKAIEHLKKTPATGIYALAMRCQVWNQLPQTPDVRAAMARDVKPLLNGLQREGKNKGFYPYVTGEKMSNLRRSHYGVLGVWAAAQSGAEVPNSYWLVAERAWLDQQDASGGWSYRGKEGKGNNPVSLDMTADGIATLFITQDYLHADEAVTPRGNIKNANIDRAMKWLTENADIITDDKKFNRAFPQATLYALERVGAASGLKHYKDFDWYELGAQRLLRTQRSNGCWYGDSKGDEISGTCFGVMFLSRGRAPVVFNKLSYQIDGKTDANWNQRPRDIANVTRWIGRQSERNVNWQIVNLDAALTDLHDAPILYVAGNQEIRLTKEHTEKLRAYIESGGMVLANADGGAEPFVASFKKLGKTLFPEYEFRQLPAEHIVFTNQQFPAANWKRKPAVLSLGNGVRELMIIVPDNDLSRAWQVQQVTGKEEIFQLAANLYFYAIDKRNAVNRGESSEIMLDTRIKPARTIELARIKFPGNWNPEPGGWRRMAALLNNRDKVRLNVTTIDPAKATLPVKGIAHLTGIGKFKLDDVSRAATKKFVEAGGTLVIDAAGGDGAFAQAAEAELVAIFGANATTQLKQPLPTDHPLYRVGGRPLENAGYRPYARQKLAGELKGPRLRGITIDGRLAVIFSAEDLSAGLVGDAVDGVIGYDIPTATALMRYILLGAPHISPVATTPPTTNSAR